MIGCEQALFAVALSRFVPLVPALIATAVLYFVTVRRFMAQLRDQPRPRWVTLLLDAPLFWHFGATTLILVLSPLCLAWALVGAVGQGGSLACTRTRASEPTLRSSA